MAKKQEKMVSEITSMEEDFSKWYTDIVKKAELIDYSGVRGCYVLRPYGYAIWENIQRILDARFKELGHENVSMPMFIPEGLLQKEKDHVEGFAPECAWVTVGGSEELQERLCVRPTSETLFCEHYAHVIHSYRDLPMLYNQWCSVVRWEKTTRPFLRSLEFLWQEGHTMHETAEEAKAETLQMLDVYAEFCENSLAIPVLKGRKTKKEQFAGAEATYTIEAMMHDGVALQAGTTHYFGDGFARAFDIQFTGRDNKLAYPHQTSWGVSTRLIGGIIMTHGDNNGLALPPAIAPIQLIIIPIAQHKEGVLEKAAELAARLKPIARVKVDDSENSPGWKSGPRISSRTSASWCAGTTGRRLWFLWTSWKQPCRKPSRRSTTAFTSALWRTGKRAPLPPITGRNFWTSPTTRAALSRPCGAATRPERTRSRS